MTQPAGQPSAVVVPLAVGAGDEVAVPVVGAALAVWGVVVVGAAAVVAGAAVAVSLPQPAARIRIVNSNSNFFMMHYSLWWLKKTVITERVFSWMRPYQFSLTLA